MKHMTTSAYLRPETEKEERTRIQQELRAAQHERAACLDLPLVDVAHGFACDDPELFARIQATIDNEPTPPTRFRSPERAQGEAARASKKLTSWFRAWAARARKALKDLEREGPTSKAKYVAAYIALRDAIHAESPGEAMALPLRATPRTGGSPRTLTPFCAAWPAMEVPACHANGKPEPVKLMMKRWPAEAPKIVPAVGVEREKLVAKAAKESWVNRQANLDAQLSPKVEENSGA